MKKKSTSIQYRLKSQIREAISSHINSRVNESLMGDIDLVAQESTSFQHFLKNVKSDPQFKMADIYDREVLEFLQGIWDDAVKTGTAGRNSGV